MIAHYGHTVARMDHNREVADAIAAAIAASNTSVNQVADHTGMARTTLKRKLAGGGGHLTVIEVSAIADVLHVDIGDLLPIRKGGAA